jgi:hypothetical protein
MEVSRVDSNQLPSCHVVFLSPHVTLDPMLRYSNSIILRLHFIASWKYRCGSPGKDVLAVQRDIK